MYIINCSIYIIHALNIYVYIYLCVNIYALKYIDVYIFLPISYVWVFCLYVCLCSLSIPYHTRHQIPWNWNYRSWSPLCGCGESNVGPWQNQVLLAIKLFLQPQKGLHISISVNSRLLLDSLKHHCMWNSGSTRARRRRS